MIGNGNGLVTPHCPGIFRSMVMSRAPLERGARERHIPVASALRCTGAEQSGCLSQRRLALEKSWRSGPCGPDARRGPEDGATSATRPWDGAGGSPEAQTGAPTSCRRLAAKEVRSPAAICERCDVAVSMS